MAQYSTRRFHIILNHCGAVVCGKRLENNAAALFFLFFFSKCHVQKNKEGQCGKRWSVGCIALPILIENAVGQNTTFMHVQNPQSFEILSLKNYRSKQKQFFFQVSSASNKDFNQTNAQNIKPHTRFAKTQEMRFCSKGFSVFSFSFQSIQVFFPPVLSVFFSSLFLYFCRIFYARGRKLRA